MDFGKNLAVNAYIYRISGVALWMLSNVSSSLILVWYGMLAWGPMSLKLDFDFISLHPERPYKRAAVDITEDKSYWGFWNLHKIDMTSLFCKPAQWGKQKDYRYL